MSSQETKPIRLLNLGLTESWRTQAVYHAVAELMQADSPDTIILCRPQTPYLCLGYHQIYDATFDRAECERRQLPVYRRKLGGGATYLDGNQLFYQCVFHHSRLPVLLKEIYQRLLAAPVATLRRWGCDAALRDLNEVEVEGKRIAGIGGGRLGEAAVVVGNILFDFDYATMAQVWNAPSKLFRELAAQTLQEHLTTLARLHAGVSMAEVESVLIEEFINCLQRPVIVGDLTAAEETHARKLAKRMTSAEYLNMHRENGRLTPMDSLKIAANIFIRTAEVHLNGRTVRASFCVRHNLISKALIESIPAGNWQKTESRLQGMPFHEWKKFL
jgi:lipoate-protein ligase A